MKASVDRENLSHLLLLRYLHFLNPQLQIQLKLRQIPFIILHPHLRIFLFLEHQIAHQLLNVRRVVGATFQSAQKAVEITRTNVRLDVEASLFLISDSATPEFLSQVHAIALKTTHHAAASMEFLISTSAHFNAPGFHHFSMGLVNH